MLKPSCIFLALLILSLSCTAPPAPEGDYAHWRTYRGDKTSSQYSTLDQINRENVDQLEIIWTYHTGDAGKRTSIQCNPIIIDQTLYGTSPQGKAFALDATTGIERWSFDPATFGEVKTIMGGVNRGVTYWAEKADRRIFHAAGYRLFALDADSGKTIRDFGEGGFADLRKGLGVDSNSVTITLTTPGIVYENLLIVGSAVGEGYDSSPGHIRAYHTQTGELVWTFHTIPQAGTFGHDSWSWKPTETYGGANAWSGMSLDEERGLVFAATGSPAYDFYGGGRKGKNLFGNCILALDAKTGERVWHFQAVHHDLWDYDLPCAPNLVTIEQDGRSIDAVAQVTKMGHIFVLDRETGAPIFPVEERPVPASTLPGEAAWPTQPVPLRPPPFTRQGFTEADLTDISPESRRYADSLFSRLLGGPLFTPPSAIGTVMMPGTRGGAEWSGAAFDPKTGMLYVNANEIPNLLEMMPIETTASAGSSDGHSRPGGLALGRQLYQQNCASCHGLELQGAPPAIPALKEVASRYDELADIKSVIRNGKGAMVGFPQFSEEELEQITDFLTSDERSYSSSSAGFSEAGKQRFIMNGYRQFLDQYGYPAIQPPWGTLNAIDLNKGEILWQVPLGEFPELIEQGLPPTGTQNLGGCLATAGGLLFIGATKDERFRAFDKESGAILWQTQLPYGGYATPATYSIDGKQYIVIAAGGGGKNGTPAGDVYIAYGLKD